MSLLNVVCPDSSPCAEALIDFTTAYAALKRRSSTVAHDFATFLATGEACLSNHLMSLLNVACPDSSLRAEALIGFHNCLRGAEAPLFHGSADFAIFSAVKPCPPTIELAPKQ